MALVILVTPPPASDRRPGLLHIDGQAAVWSDERKGQAESQASESRARYPEGWRLAVMFEGDAFRQMRGHA